MANATATELQQLYIAYFGRAADPTGLDYWTDEGITTKAFAANMYAQNEFKSVYGDLTVEAQVNQIYQNLFDRDADPTGLIYWTNQINNGVLELASIANDLIWAANNNSGSEDDKTALTNKTNAAVAYTAKVEETTAGILAYAPTSSSPWVAGDNITEAVNYFKGIDKDTVHTTSNIASSVSTIVANGVQANAKTFTLTTGVNDFEGGNGADTFDASTSKSLNTGDTLVGGAGTDTLTANFAAAHTATVNSTGIEVFNITTTTGATTLNLSSASGVTTLKNTGSTADLTLNNISSVPTNVDINTDGGNTTTLNFLNSAMSGTSDDLLINLDGVTGTIAVTRSAGATNTLEVISLHSKSVTNTIADLQTTGATTKLELTGDQALVITAALDNDVVTIDGSNATGAITLTTGTGTVTTSTGSAADSVTAGSGDNSITGNAGADTFTFGANGGLDSDDTVSGGAGTDILKIETAATNETIVLADFTNVTGVETLTAGTTTGLGGNLGALASTAGITTVTYADTGASDALVIDAEFANDLTVNLTNSGSGIDTLNASAFTKVLTVKATATFADAANHVITGGTGTTDELLITADSNGIDTASMNTLTAFEKLTVANDAALGTVVVGSATAGDAVTFTIDATAQTTSTSTSKFDLTADTDAKYVVKLGAGADTVVGSVSDNGDNISGNAGADTFIFAGTDLSSADTIAGGAGTDILQYAETDTNETIALADFTNITDVETITAGSTTGLGGNLGALASTAGITTVTYADTGASDALVIDAEFANDLTVNLTNSGSGIDTLNASAFTKVLTVKATATFADAANHVITGGTGTTDELLITAVNASTGIDEASMATLTAFEKLTIANDAAFAAIAVDELSAADGATFTIDATAQTSSTSTGVIDLTKEDNGYNVVKAGAGADTITISASDQGDNISGNAGADTFKFASANLSSADTITGGAGTDILSSTGNASDTHALLDADFTNVTGVETFNMEGTNADFSVTLGSEAAAAGIVTLGWGDTDGSGADTITIGSGFTNDLAITSNDTTGNDKIVATGYTKNLTITMDADALDGSDTITGGSGTDTLRLVNTATTALSEADFAGVTAIETIDIYTTEAMTVAVDEETVASGQTVNITNTKQTTTVATINASAVSTAGGAVSITLGGTGDHQVVLGYGNDTYTSTSSAAEDVTATAGNNTITTGAGADVITLGTGNDKVTGEAGADDFKVATAYFTSDDTLIGGAGVDEVILSDAATVVDADFTNVTTTETLTVTGGASSVTLGALSAAAGIDSVTGSTGADTITIGANSNSTLSIGAAASGNDSINASGYSGTLTVTVADAADLTAADTITGGTGTSDTLSIASSGAITADESANISGFETLKIANTSVAASITLADAVVGAGKSLTVDAGTVTTGAILFSGAAETDGTFNISTTSTGNHTITLGAGNDTVSLGTAAGDNAITLTGGNNQVTSGTGDDTITLGDGNDSIVNSTGASIVKVTTAGFTFADTLTLGTGTDTISLTDAATIIDADFTNVTGLATLQNEGTDAGNTITLGAKAAAAGLATITLADTNSTGEDVITVGSGFTNDLAITWNDTTGNDKIDATGYTKDLTITMDADALDENDTITGGSGTDTLRLVNTAATALSEADFAGVTAIETIDIYTTEAFTVAVDDETVASGQTVNITNTKHTTAIATINATAVSTSGGNVNITLTGTSGNAGNHIVTLGFGDDTLTSSTSGAHNSVTATAGTNTITLGTDEDTVVSGTGIDTIDFGDDNVIDTYSTLGNDSGNSYAQDVLTNFDNINAGGSIAEDVISFNLTEIAKLGSGGTTLTLLDIGKSTVNVAATNAAVITDVTAAYDLVGTTSTNILALDADFASTSAVEDALEAGGSMQLTANIALEIQDGFVVTYDDGTDSYVAVMEVLGVVGNDDTFHSGSLKTHSIAKISGLADNTDLIIGNFAFA